MKYKLYFRILAVVFVCASLMPASQPAHAEKGTLALTVNSSADLSDVNHGDGFCNVGAAGSYRCTLRAAIEEANHYNPAPNSTVTIGFVSNYTITPAGDEYETFDNTNGRHIYVNGGSNTIVVDGTGVTGGNKAGFTLGTGDRIQGITIQNFSYGVIIIGDNSLVGTDGDGVNDTLERNIVLDNIVTGVQVSGDYNHVAGNYIGINASSSTTLGNHLHGVQVYGVGNIIGVDGSNDAYNANERNVISCNGRNGVHVINMGPEGNVIAGNYIGTSITGIADRGNVWSGIEIASNSSNGAVRIGTNADGIADDTEGNVISGNYINGILVEKISLSSGGVTIAGNKIGTNATGSEAIGNSANGVDVRGTAAFVQIGTNGDGVNDSVEGNLISGNGNYGVYLATFYNSVAGNKIGTNAAGDAAIGNGFNGVYIAGANNTVGMSADGHPGLLWEKNLISGNVGCGVYVNGEAADFNLIAGNYIGTNAAGDTAIPNTTDGVCIGGGADDTTIGSNQDGVYDAYETNFISGNAQNGVEINAGSASTITNIVDNRIGTSAEGYMAVPNGGDGIRISGGNITYATGNVVGWNGSDGMDFRGSDDGVINGNYIGISPDGDAIPNAGNGFLFGSGAATYNIGDNSIAYNTQSGIYMDTGAGSNVVWYNRIYSNGLLGIDLAPLGVNANDYQDGDSGPNNLQNYPVLSSVVWQSINSVGLSGTFNSIPSHTFSMKVYANADCDPSGYGEGEEYVIGFTLITDANGDANFGSLVLTAGFWVSHPYITTVAVDVADNSTSEFSNCVKLELEQVYLPMISN
jgi:CSLREA domain-containing protein